MTDKGPYSFPCSRVWMWELDHKEGWAPKNEYFWIVVLEKMLQSLLDSKEIKPVRQSTLKIHWKDWCWSWSSNTLATWREELTRWKRPWCWERLKAGGEGDVRRWDGWMASPTRWTWVWASSRRWWRTGKPGVLQSMGSQRVRHNWATEQQQMACTRPLSCPPLKYPLFPYLKALSNLYTTVMIFSCLCTPANFTL